MFGKYLAIVWTDFTGAINLKNMFLHTETFEQFQKQKKVKKIKFEGDSTYGEYYIGEVYKSINGLWNFRYVNKNNNQFFDVELNEEIINLDIVMYYYHYILSYNKLPNPLEIRKTEIFSTNRLSFVSTIKYFKPDLIKKIIHDYCSVTGNIQVEFININNEPLELTSFKENDFEYIEDKACRMSFKKICFCVKSPEHIDRMKVYRLINLLSNTGWNDERFIKFLKINEDNLFSVSEKNVCAQLKTVA